MSYTNPELQTVTQITIADRIVTTEVYHCIICLSEQPKLQKFLSDSSQRLSNYFCNLYHIKNTNYRLDIEVIFQDAIICSPCNQELKDVETLNSQIERLNSEIQRIKLSYDSKLKIFETKNNKGTEGVEVLDPETRKKGEQLYNYAFRIKKPKTTRETFPVRNSKSDTYCAASTSTSTQSVLSRSHVEVFENCIISDSNEAIETACGENIGTFGFELQETSSIGFEYEDLETENGDEKEVLYPFIPCTNKAVDNDIDNNDCGEVMDADPFAVIKTEKQDEDESSFESEDRTERQDNYNLRELSITVERLSIPVNETTVKLSLPPKRKYIRKLGGEIAEKSPLKPKRKYVRKPVDNDSTSVNRPEGDNNNLMKLLPKPRRKYIRKKLPSNDSRLKLPLPTKPKRKYVRRELGVDPRKKKFPFACPYPECSKTFSVELQRDGHIKRAHEGILKPFTCDICKKNFPGYAELRDHQNLHKGLTPYPCTKCDNSFATKIKLRYHRNTVHNENPFRCDQCDKVLCNSRVHEDHMRSHRKERPFICEICQRSFTNRDILRNHRLTHPELNLGVPECRFCGRVFAGGKYYLEMHERQHTGDVRFKCDVCNFGTSLKTVFTRHMLTHCEKKNFECSICEHKFKSLNLLNHHKRSYHPPTKNFMCSQCGKCFTCKRYLERHEEIHKEVKRLLCTRCGKSFAQHTSYNYHMKKAHKDDPCSLVKS